MKANYKKYLKNPQELWKELSIQGEAMNIHIGDKVKLNYKKIIQNPDYDSMLTEYKEWVENNKNKTFTVQQDKLKANPHRFSAIVSLKEDITEPKWLFSVEDLIKMEDNNERILLR